MDKKFKPGDKIKKVEKDTEECLVGEVISADGDYTVIQWEELDHPSTYTETELEAIELC